MSTRKAVNLTRDPRIAFVFGSMLPDASWGIQVEGLADQSSAEKSCHARENHEGRHCFSDVNLWR
jgi:hypothetical protein